LSVINLLRKALEINKWGTKKKPEM